MGTGITSFSEIEVDLTEDLYIGIKYMTQKNVSSLPDALSYGDLLSIKYTKICKLLEIEFYDIPIIII